MSLSNSKRSSLVIALASVLTVAGGASAFADRVVVPAPAPRPTVVVHGVPTAPPPGVFVKHPAPRPEIVIKDGVRRDERRGWDRFFQHGRPGVVTRYSPPQVVTPIYVPPPVYVPVPTVVSYPAPAPTITADFASAIGRPPDAFAAGASGTFIWMGTDGVFHVRTTSAGQPASFAGAIGSPDGSLDLVGTTNAARQTADGIRFGFATAGAPNSVEFKLESGQCVSFDIGQNGGGVYLGGNESSMPSSFDLCR
jgi:hypothetical protein